MKIRLILSIMLMLILISIISSNSPNRIHDSLAITSQDSLQGKQSQTTGTIDIIGWIEKHPASIGLLGVIVGGIFTLVALRAKKWLDRRSEEKKERNALKTEEDRYVNFIINQNEKLTFQGFETSVRTPILLWDVYVPLRANIAGLGIRDREFLDRGEIQEYRDLSVEEAIQFATGKQYDGLIILGDPGAGKTTLLRYFLLCFAKKEAATRLNLPGDLLPILLPLRNVKLEQNFIEALCSQFHGYALKLSESFFIDHLEKGKAIVLLDGLDEVADKVN